MRRLLNARPTPMNKAWVRCVRVIPADGLLSGYRVTEVRKPRAYRHWTEKASVTLTAAEIEEMYRMVQAMEGDE